ncbi:guanylate kinase [Legionella spiritensis]|uniref:Guanylate kinase n=1 Tax=Legionella spiritensis TaxID=452 RepID=A0A0W0YXB2_LEGSP|nr:guanylate kinase [Legionella spiritensis]KTD61513.1 guanylate kinase [Legionella spiritensis]SNV32941.1 guanylate kinase [Legionella spiritensis]VEG92316.1 guanylate kinase [Legionella spiritensis]
MTDSSQGNLFIVAAPSGGGKTSLVKKLIQSLDDIAVSISHTTRPQRPGEQDGVDYFFVSRDQFLDMINENDFLEHAVVFNHYYGTSVAQINRLLDEGKDVVLDIDWQGAQQIRHIYPRSVSIFVVPPSLTVLKKRLEERRQDDHKVIAARMQRAQDELSHFSEFDYLIINDEFNQAAMDLQAIVRANRLTLKRQSEKAGKLLSFLLSSQ